MVWKAPGGLLVLVLGRPRLSAPSEFVAPFWRDAKDALPHRAREGST